jgi:uncharacterized Zn-binding protein involved in type VI secretion
MATKKIACLGDPASHPGTINTSGQSGLKKAGGSVIAVLGATFACLIPYHGTTPITPITTKSRIEGKLIITEGATAGCGAVIAPSPRQVFVE